MGKEIESESDGWNRYAPPSAAIEPSNPEPESSESRLFFRWEKLRLLYNAILGVETALLLVLFPPRMPHGLLMSLLFPLAVLCFAANVCFCIGPVLNGYAHHWMGLRHGSVTVLIFASGTTLAILLTYIAIFSMGFGGFGAID